MGTHRCVEATETEMKTSDGAVVRHDADRHRYEYVVDGRPLAVAEYRTHGDTAVMHHTYTHPSFRGRGYAASVVAAALDDLRARGMQIVPQCPFVAEFVAAHPQYQDLVTTA
jgi:predicted GNAT family acetyltransferase